jgi:murein DD-endopeptidase MepM/ murein hydrolase activator NlpD
VTCRPFYLLIAFITGLAMLVPSSLVASDTPPVEQNVQGFLDAQPGALKSFRDGDHTAAEWIQGVGSYYGVSPRILLALLEANQRLLSDPNPGAQALREPLGPAGPDGFGAQIDWAGSELRAGFGPYDRPPTVRFTDGTTLTLTLEQAPEGVAIQRFLAKGRSQAEWRTAFDRFLKAFQTYFNNELPDDRPQQPPATAGFLKRPWPAGTRVVHLAYFDHMFPTVDTGQRGNGFVVNHFGQGNVQYDGHDGHDFYFPDQPIGSHILAAADGIAYARTHRGNGVVIIHPDGYETVYWHLDQFATIFQGKVDTGKGVTVKAGDLIGSSGKTGFVKGTPHLHFEVRHNGRQIDPYGWYGPGPDPCTAYAACAAGRWLWHDSLIGEFDFTPPNVAPIDRTPPGATITANPPDDLVFLANFDDVSLQRVGVGTPTVAGTQPYEDGRFGKAAQITREGRLAYPTANNLRLDAGTIAFWAKLPERYPDTSTGRNYLLAASAHPDEGPVYIGTLALRRDEEPNGAPRWTFWTTPESGEPGRNDLSAPDTLNPGWRYFAITWDRAAGSKALYLDGKPAASTSGVTLPQDVGEMLELGRFSPAGGYSGVAIDELAIFSRALEDTEIAQLSSAQAPLLTHETLVAAPEFVLDVNATDDAGGIVSVQTAINGVFDDPQPYHEGYRITLPQTSGAISETYTVAARFFDRAGNSATVSTTVRFAPLQAPGVTVEETSEREATLVIANGIARPNLGMWFIPEIQLSPSPDFPNTPWQAFRERIPWRWSSSKPRVVWVRFRVNGTISPAQPIGPDVRRVYLPLARSFER